MTRNIHIVALIALLSLGFCGCGEERVPVVARPKMSDELARLLSSLDGEPIGDSSWKWEPWAKSQLKAGAEYFIKEGQLSHRNVSDFLTQLGRSPVSDVCWVYSTTEGLFALNSLDGLGAENRAFYGRPEYKNALRLREQFSQVVVKHFLRDPEFRKRYVRIMMWNRVFVAGHRINLDVAVKHDRYLGLADDYFSAEGPYAGQRLLGFAVILEILGEDARLKELTCENANDVFVAWKRSRSSWLRRRIPSVSRPKTPSPGKPLAGYPNVLDLMDEGVHWWGFQAWVRQAQYVVTKQRIEQLRRTGYDNAERKSVLVAKFLQEGFKRNEKGVYFRTGLSLKQVEEAIEFSEKTGERYHPGSLGPGEIIVILYTPDAMVRYEDTTIGKSNPRAYITIRKKSVEKKDMP